MLPFNAKLACLLVMVVRSPSIAVKISLVKTAHQRLTTSVARDLIRPCAFFCTRGSPWTSGGAGLARIRPSTSTVCAGRVMKKTGTRGMNARSREHKVKGGARRVRRGKAQHGGTTPMHAFPKAPMGI